MIARQNICTTKLAEDGCDRSSFARGKKWRKKVLGAVGKNVIDKGNVPAQTESWTDTSHEVSLLNNQASYREKLTGILTELKIGTDAITCIHGTATYFNTYLLQCYCILDTWFSSTPTPIMFTDDLKIRISADKIRVHKHISYASRCFVPSCQAVIAAEKADTIKPYDWSVATPRTLHHLSLK